MSYRSSRLNCTLGKTRFLILGLLILAAALAACGGGGGGEAMAEALSAQEVGEGGGPAAYKPPAVPAEVKFISGADRQFGELGPGLQFAADVGDPDDEGVVAISTTIQAGVSVWEDIVIEDWTVFYDEYFYGLEGVLTLDTEEYGVFELGPGDAIWLPEGTTLTYSAKEKTTVVVAVYPANWRERMPAE